jgi:hypothetical protein
MPRFSASPVSSGPRPSVQRLGLNLRMLALIVLPVPLVVWPVATVAGSIMFSLVVGFLWPLWGTVMLGSLLEGGRLLSSAVMEPLEMAQVRKDSVHTVLYGVGRLCTGRRLSCMCVDLERVWWNRTRWLSEASGGGCGFDI